MTGSPDFTWLFLKMLAGLVVVVGLALFLIRFVLPRTRLGKSHALNWVETIGRVALDQTRSLCLVKIAGRYFVLGMAEKSVNLITEISSAEGEKIENS